MCNYNARGHRARATEMTTAMDTLGTGDGGGVSSSTRTPQWVRPLCRSQRQKEPSSSASIPSRYQTYFYSSTENKGFNSQATRFTDHLEVNDTPGPGAYSTQPHSLERHSTSFSKKGTGGLAALRKRFSRIRLEKLSPASYTPRLPMDHHDFNRALTSKNFHSPIATKTEPESRSPAPNTYIVNRVHVERNNVVTGEAAFKSKTQREAMDLPTARNPAPCQYKVSEDLLHPSTCQYKSVFNSKSIRNFTKPHKGPGPADYSPHEDAKKMKGKHNKHKHHLCFSAPALPLPPLPPPPGPGHYEIMDKMAIGGAVPEKDMVTSDAVFKSVTGRIPTSSGTKIKIGPGSYDPMDGAKRSYFYNVHSVWV